ncbi:MAG: N-acetyltransferase [Candidatus Eisenbacteria bacterium]|nr:N-acetyltransferase [Candidatus Eisenbacteria bacterium]
MAVNVERVTGRRDLHRFVTFPWRVYAGDPHWVPPLIGDTKKTLQRHPFHEHAEVDYFLARRDDALVGRIAAIRNDRHNQEHDERIAFFGFFEASDAEAARALLGTVESWAAAQELVAVRGPANFSSNEEWGLLVEGFDAPPAIMMTYNPPRYIDYLEGAGYAKAKDLLAYFLDDPNPSERILRTAEKMAARRGVSVRPLNMKRFEEDVGLVREVYNEAWEQNWGFVSMTEAEIEHMAKELRPVVKPELILLAEKGERPVGFAMALPDYNAAIRHANGRLFPFGLLKILWHARKIHKLRVLTLGLVPEMRRTGVEQLLYLRIFQGGQKLGIDEGEMSWILEDNHAMRQGLERIGCRAYKTYRIYEKHLTP